MQRIYSPRTDDHAIEAEIRERASTAPRVTMEDIEANIVSEHYFTAANGADSMYATSVGADGPAPLPLHLLTFCVLVLKNGFTVTGESACASPENFDEAIGRKLARGNAINKLWPLLGFRLRDRLFEEARTSKPIERDDF